MRGSRSPLGSRARLQTVLFVTIFTLAPVIAGAIEFDLINGKVTGHFDTTVSVGLSWRVSDPDLRLIGTANGGTGNSLNGDDGNLNYDAGDIFSENLKVLHEISFDYDDYFVFIRGFYFSDFAIREGDVLKEGRPALSGTAERFAGLNAVLLDAYVRRDFGGIDNPLTLTVGSQVINWGESTFIQNGLNGVNPVDLSKLRAAGSEIKEALVPIPAAKFDYDLSDTVSLQGFYQLGWRPTRLEPIGTFFSVTDIASPGGNFVLLGFGQTPDDGVFVQDNPPGASVFDPNDPVGVVVQRTGDRTPSNLGQYGISARWFAEELGGTEFGFYYTHLHSRLPIISAITGDPLTSLPEGVTYGDSAEYFLEYPEDITTIGVSFNTDLFDTGIAVQGEASLHLDQPLQVDDTEILFAALSPLNSGAFGPGTLGIFDFGETIHGFVRKDVATAQFSLTKVMAGVLGADQVAMVGEFAAMFVNEMEDQANFRYEATGTYTSGNDFFTGLGIQPGTEPLSAFPDQLSMGYKALVKATYYNAIGSLALAPIIAFSQDIEGTSPVPLANFIEGRKTVSASVTVGALGLWDVKLGYTNSFGAGRYNLRNDRDFMSLTASYSF
ncbi:MAG: DUF1302 domain-containing protein [bacterium]